MISLYLSIIIPILLIVAAHSYSVSPSASPSHTISSRKAFLTNTITASLAILGTSPSYPALADDPDEIIDCYFGMGCFWHIQHVSYPNIFPGFCC
jgi:hypothetical protein